jgi:hypothetical protein
VVADADAVALIFTVDAAACYLMILDEGQIAAQANLALREVLQ